MARRRHTSRDNFQRGSISGVEEAVRRLQAIGRDVLFAAELALADGVDRIVEDAKSRCPVRTGALRDSIRAVDVANGAAYEISADAENAQGIAYGQFVEFAPNGHPFLYPAIDANINFVKREIAAAIQEAIAYRSSHGHGAA